MQNVLEEGYLLGGARVPVRYVLGCCQLGGVYKVYSAIDFGGIRRGAKGLQVLFRALGIPALFLAVPAITGRFQGVAGGLTWLAGEVDLYAVKLGVDLYPEESGVAGLDWLGFFSGGNAGGLWSEFNVLTVVPEATEIVEIYIEIINHSVAVVRFVGANIFVYSFGSRLDLIRCTAIPIAVLVPNAGELLFKIGIVPAGDAEYVVVIYAADKVVLALILV